MDEETFAESTDDWHVVLQVRPPSAGDQACRQRLLPSQWDQFVQGMIANLQSEFSPRLKIIWEVDRRRLPARPEILLDGDPVPGCHFVGPSYLSWSMLRLAVASRMLAKRSFAGLLAEAQADLERLGLSAASWQDGLLEWAAQGGG
jgi:hypothetical protein